MPRKQRIQYSDAIYHTLSRGDRCEDILLDDVDLYDFLKTLAASHMSYRPIVELYWNRTTGSFAILRYALDPQSDRTVGYGRLVRIRAGQMEERGLDVLLTCLEETKNAAGPEKCELEDLDATGWSLFRRDHKLVQVEQLNECTLAWDPMKPERGGWISVREKPILTALPLSKPAFVSVVKRAVQEAE